MKKLFTLAAAVIASMAMNADVIFGPFTLTADNNVKDQVTAVDGVIKIASGQDGLHDILALIQHLPGLHVLVQLAVVELELEPLPGRRCQTAHDTGGEHLAGCPRHALRDMQVTAPARITVVALALKVTHKRQLIIPDIDPLVLPA